MVSIMYVAATDASMLLKQYNCLQSVPVKHRACFTLHISILHISHSCSRQRHVCCKDKCAGAPCHLQTAGSTQRCRHQPLVYQSNSFPHPHCNCHLLRSSRVPFLVARSMCMLTCCLHCVAQGCSMQIVAAPVRCTKREQHW